MRPTTHPNMGVSKNKGTPKWMVKIMENPIKMDDLGVPLFSETSIYYCLVVFPHPSEKICASQNGNLPQVGVTISKKYLKPPPCKTYFPSLDSSDIRIIHVSLDRPCCFKKNRLRAKSHPNYQMCGKCGRS